MTDGAEVGMGCCSGLTVKFAAEFSVLDRCLGSCGMFCTFLFCFVPFCFVFPGKNGL